MDPGRRRIPQTPAFDGLRALGMIVVLVYHQDPRLIPGAWLAVSMFFTLSGFLIGDMLLSEHASTGRIDLKAFWVQRVRRLAPASVIALALALGVLVGIGGNASAAIGDVRAAALQVANWRFIAAGAPYVGLDDAPSPVQHYWSLAIEEQFYLVLPVVAALVLRRRLLGWVALAAAGASLFAQLRIDEIDRAYLGTDARAAELAVGVALAVALPAVRGAMAERRWLADGWAVAASVGTVVAMAAAPRTSDVVLSGLLTAVTILWVGLLVGSLYGRLLPWAIGRQPLIALGKWSYGIYLYHWPVYLVLTPDRTGLSGAALLAVRAGSSIFLAWLSVTLVELPIRHGSLAPRRLVPLAGAAMASVLVLTLFVGTDDRVTTVAGGELLAPPPSRSVTLPAPVTSAPVEPGQAGTGSSGPDGAGPDGADTDGAGIDGTVAATAAVAAAAPAPANTSEPTVAPTTPAPTAPPTTAPPTTAPRPPTRPTRVLVVGDSTARLTGEGMQTAAAQRGDAEVYVYAESGCTVYRQERALIRDGYEYRSGCEDIVLRSTQVVADIEPDVIVVMIGSIQLADARYGDDNRWRTILDPGAEVAYRRALARSVDALVATGVPVLWGDVPLPAWDLDAFGQMMGTTIPGVGEATTNDPARANRLNAIDSEVLSRYPGVRRWSYSAVLAGPDGVIDPDLRVDGLHLSAETAAQISRQSLLDVLRDAAHPLLASGATGGSGTAVPAWALR